MVSRSVDCCPMIARLVRGVFFVLSVGLILTGMATAAEAQPGFSKQFLPNTIGPGSNTRLTFTIVNGSGAVVGDLAFTDALPPAITVSTPPSATTDCGAMAVLSAPAGAGMITFSGGQVAAFDTCTVSVNVISSTVGTHMNTSGDLTSDAGNSGVATDDLTVEVARPGFSKSFSPASVGLGGRSTLTFTVDNTLGTSNLFSLSFQDSLPMGLEVADPPNASTDCPASGFNAMSGGSLVSLVGAFVALSPGATCTAVVDVKGIQPGTWDNVSDELFSTPGGALRSSGFATATLEVAGGALLTTKDFTDDPVLPGGTTTLEFTILNRDRNFAATNLTFTDDLDATLTGLVATGLPLADPCGAGSTLTGTSLLTLSGGTIPAEGSCTFSVTLQVPAGAAAGAYPNTTSTVSADVGGSPITGDPATETLFVSDGPTITKTFLTDPVGGGATTQLEFTITNNSATSAATDITFNDDLDAFLSGVVVTGGTGANVCGAGSFLGTTFIAGNLNLFLMGGTLAAGDSCTFTVDLSVPAGAPAGVYTNTTTAISGTVDAVTQFGNVASDTLTVVSAPDLTKTFTDDPVLPGDTVTLEFTLSHDIGATADATAIAFTDDLAGTLMGLAATGLPMNDVCGTGSMISGTTNLSFTGGTLAPGASCTFSVTLQVPAAAPPGAFTNTTSNVMATVSGVATVGSGAADVLDIAGLTLTKEFIDDPVVPGATATLRFTIDNVSPASDATGIFFTDNLPTALSGLVATALPPAGFCGAPSMITGPSLLIVTNAEVAASTSCTFDVTVQVPAGAASGSYVNNTSNLSAMVDGNTVILPPASDALVVERGILALTKSFTDDPVAPGDPVNLEFTLSNLSATETVTGITFTDDLDAALTGLAATGTPIMDPCGAGSMLSGVGLLTLTGGTLAPSASCTFSVSLVVPASTPFGTIATNVTSDVTGTASSSVDGSPAMDDLVIDFLTFSKAFDGPSVAGGTPTLTVSIENLSTTDTVSGLAFSDDLDAVLTGLVATGLPLADVCGTGSSVNGTSFLTFTGGSLLPGGTCTIVVPLQVPANATAGTYPNTTSDLQQSGLPVAMPATADLVIEPPPTFAKVFAPAGIGLGLTSTLTFTIDNTVSAVAASALAFTDNLPAGLAVATPAVTANTCGGTLTATAGSGTITLTGGTVGAGATCTVDVEVVASALGSLVNTTGDLTSSSGNSGTATDTLVVVAPPAFAKAFAPTAIASGGTSTLTFTIDNTGSTVTATALAFTDNLPAAVTVATPANVVNTCGGTVTATSGTGVISLTGGTAAATCTINVDTTSTTVGSHVNLTGDLTSSLGNSGTATDTLVVVPPPTFAKAFAPDAIASGGVSTLTFTIDNTGSSIAATALAFTDNLPVAVTVATPANVVNTCGGTVTATSGTGVISLTGGTAAATCTISVDTTSTTVGSHVNLSGDLTSSLGNSGTATDTLVVVPPPTFAKAFAPDTINVGATSTVTFTIDNTASSLAATSLDFTDTMPVEITVETPANVVNTCGGTVTAIPGTNVISLTGGTVGVSTTCTVSVDVTSVNAGMHVNLTGDLTSSLGNSGTATDTLTANPRSGFSKVFTPDVIPSGFVSTLTFTIDNSTATVAAMNIAFTDTMPAAILVATPANVVNTCTGGTVTATPGTSVISYSGGEVGAGATCTLSVDVTSATVGMHVNLTSDLTSSLGNSGTATDTLTVIPQPGFAKVFAPDTINVDGASTLTFTIDNTASSLAATSLDFTDTMPMEIVVAMPANVVNSCTGGTVTAVPGSSVIAYTGGMVAAGASCTLAVAVTSPTPGVHLNLTGDLTSSLGNSGTATDALTVNPPPSFAKAFGPDPIVAGTTSTLVFTIGNGASTVDATGLTFVDTLPAGLVVATPANASTTCTGGAITAAPGSGMVAYSGGTVATGVQCTVQADVTTSVPGTYVNTSGDLTSSLGNSGPATDTLEVTFAALTFDKAFAPTIIQPGETSTLTLTIDNPVNGVAVGNVAFTDTLPAGMTVATPANAATTCTGGTLTATPGSGVVSYTGGTVAATANCTVTVDVIGDTVGDLVNTTSDLTSDAGTTAPATATLTVIEMISLTKEFLSDPVLRGGLVDIQFTISNRGTTTLTEIAFTDDLDAALTGMVAVGLPVSDVCGAGSSVSGTSVISLVVGTVASGQNCVFTVTAKVPADADLGTYTNTTSPMAALANGVPVASLPASDDFEVVFLDFAKSFTAGSVTGGFTTTLTFSITNPDPANPATGITFMDDLDAVLPGLMAVGLPLADACGAGSSVTGSSLVTLNDGMVAAGGSCTFDVTVLVPEMAPAGTVTNVTGLLQAVVDGSPVTGDAAGVAMADLMIDLNILQVPTLGTWGALFLALFLALVAVRRLSLR